MTSVTLQQLDNGDVYSSNGTSQNNSQSGTINVTNCDTEQITKLFPKCRPRADVNLNPLLVVRTNSSEGHDSNMSTEDIIQNSNIETDRCEEWKKSTTKHVQEQDGDDDLNELDSNQDIGNDRIDRGLSPSADLSSEDDDDDDDAIHILNVNKGGAYKLRDSRVIEIAGGREIYSQSRTKAARKSRYIGSDYEKKKGVWDVRPLPCHDSIKLNNSREVTETVFSSEVCSIRHQRSNNNLNTTTPTTSNVKSSPSPSKSMAVVTSGEVVVFDDIGDDWRTQPDGENENESQSPFFKDFESPEPAQIIGNLPIAVYEGSPRRYGPRQPDNVPVYPPRPGFPQRVLPSEDVPQVTTSPSSEEPRLDPVNSTFDYLYEFSETRKVLEEFFKCPPDGDNSLLEENAFQDLDYELHRQARQSQVELNDGNTYVGQRLAKTLLEQGEQPNIDSPRNLSEFTKIQDHGVIEHENNFLDLSVGTGSSGDLGETEVGLQVGHSRNFTLSPETTDCDSNCGDLDSEMSLMLMENELGPSSVGLLGSSGDLVQPPDSTRLYSSMPILEDGLSSGHTSDNDNNNPTVILMKRQITEIEREIVHKSSLIGPIELKEETVQENSSFDRTTSPIAILISNDTAFQPNETDLHNDTSEVTPPPPAPAPHRRGSNEGQATQPDRVEAAIQDIRLALQRTKTLPLTNITNGTIPHQTVVSELKSNSPVWVPRQRGISQASRDSDSIERKPLSGEEAGDEEEADTDLETDRLLGQHRSDDQGFYDDKLDKDNKKKGRNKEGLHEPSVLIEGVLFRARYLGSTQLVCEGQPTKSTRMMQAEEAVSRIKALAPDGESQPSTEVDLFISTEKIMVLNTDLKEIMMDHALRTISYIADIGDLVVLMARRRLVPHEMEDPPKINRTPKMICHVFESEEAQFIAQSIGQAFQVAYMEFLKANGIEDHSFVKEMDYQEVLNSQEIFGDELQMFAKKEMQKEVVVPKSKGEILGVVIVESGWGSMLPTVVIANLAPAGAAARCGQLNIGDQIIAINGVSLVGLPLSTCQNYIKNSKNQTVVKLTVVPCAPVVEVKIKRPDTKYQLGFSVQNGVICSLLRGGIAERGGVRVGHRIIEINNQSVVAVPHEKIVNLLATSVGEILMKTMPTSMFRLLTGQENPVYI